MMACFNMHDMDLVIFHCNLMALIYLFNMALHGLISQHEILYLCTWLLTYNWLITLQIIIGWHFNIITVAGCNHMDLDLVIDGLDLCGLVYLF